MWLDIYEEFNKLSELVGSGTTSIPMASWLTIPRLVITESVIVVQGYNKIFV